MKLSTPTESRIRQGRRIKQQSPPCCLAPVRKETLSLSWPILARLSIAVVWRPDAPPSTAAPVVVFQKCKAPKIAIGAVRTPPAILAIPARAEACC
eukprot:1653564-Pyramimonas_sp.AAC.1